MFAEDIPNMDFSEEAAQAYFDFETSGKGNLKIGMFGRQEKYNGYMVGKHWMDVTIKMWKEDDRRGWYLPDELSAFYPEWWLKTIWPEWPENRV